MKRALLLAAAIGLLGCDGCATTISDEPTTPSSALVAEVAKAVAPTSMSTAASVATAPASTATPASSAEAEEDWGNAALNCEGREACLAIAARVPASEPPEIAANVRAKANGATGRCLVEAMMVAWNEDAAASCDADARHAMSRSDERLIRATPILAARAWRRLEQREAGASAAASKKQP